MNENDFMVFKEASTGKWLVVERTDDKYEFNSYLFDKNKDFAARKKLSLLFDKSFSVADDGLGKACDVAKELHGIDKTDVYVEELSNIGQELEYVKSLKSDIYQQSKSVKSTQEIAKLHSALKDALKDYDENIKDYNNLLSSYNKSQEENQKLKNQLQSQNQKKNQGISR